MKKLPLPSPTPFATPELIPVVKVMFPKLFAFFDSISDATWTAIGGFLAAFLFKWLWEVVTDHKRQTVKATILGLFNDFQERQETGLRRVSEDAKNQAIEIFTDVKKMEGTVNRTAEDIEYIKSRLDKVLDKLGDQEKRILKLEHKREVH